MPGESEAMHVEGLEDRACFDGQEGLDRSFRLPLPNRVTAVQVQPDGRVLVALDEGRTVRRFLSNGRVDRAFGGGDGVVEAGIDVRRIDLLPDGSIAAAEGPWSGARTLLLNPDGTPDARFGEAGLVRGRFVARQGDDRLIVGDVLDGDIRLCRYGPGMLADGTFGAGGCVRADFGAAEEPLALKVVGGRVLVAGYSTRADDGAFVLAAFDGRGAADPSYGTGGRVDVSVPIDGGFEKRAAVVDDGGALLFADGMYAQRAWLDVDPAGGTALRLDEGDQEVRLSSLGSVPGVVAYSFGGTLEWGIGRFEHRLEVARPDGDMTMAGDGSVVLGTSETANGRKRFMLRRYRPVYLYRPFRDHMPFHDGQRIEVEAFDRGGNGLGYSDATPGNAGDADVRGSESVDLRRAGRGAVLASAQAGEWLQYSIDKLVDGGVDVFARVAAGAGSGTIHLELDQERIGRAVRIGPSTKGRVIRVAAGVDVAAGRHLLRLVIDAASGGGPRIDWIRIERPGMTDASFGDNGVGTVRGALAPDAGEWALVERDHAGRLVVASFGAEPVLARMNPDGTVDKTFGAGGRIFLDGPDDGTLITALATGPGGFIAGVTYGGTSRLLRVFDGRRAVVKPLVGPDGEPIGGRLLSGQVAVQADGKIVVAVRRELGTRRTVLVTRVHPNGTPDHSFGKRGWTAIDLGDGRVVDVMPVGIEAEADGAVAVGITARHRLLPADAEPGRGQNRLAAAVARLDSDGKPIGSFGVAGVALAEAQDSRWLGGGAFAKTQDGYVVGVNGESGGPNFVLFDRLGGHVPAFQSRATTTLRLVEDIEVAPDGRLLVSGWMDEQRLKVGATWLGRGGRPSHRSPIVVVPTPRFTTGGRIELDERGRVYVAGVLYDSEGAAALAVFRMTP